MYDPKQVERITIPCKFCGTELELMKVTIECAFDFSIKCPKCGSFNNYSSIKEIRKLKSE
jgi:uncharacterized Zn finger protein